MIYFVLFVNIQVSANSLRIGAGGLVGVAGVVLGGKYEGAIGILLAKLIPRTL